MRCNDCGTKVVSSGLVYCPKCSGRLNKRANESRHELPLRPLFERLYSL